VLVTGASGRLGRRVAARLAGRVAGDRLLLTAPAPGRQGGLPAIGVDLADHARLAALARAHRPDVVVHLGALTSAAAAERDPLGALDVNVLATAVLRDVADELGAFLLSASGPAAGETALSDEDHSGHPQPLDHLGRTRRLAELVVLGDGSRAGDGRHLVVRLPPAAAAQSGATARTIVDLAALRPGGTVDLADPQGAVVSDPRPPPAADPRAEAGREAETMTVFVPAHECEADLGRCLASLGVQTFVGTSALRVVTVANGCTDGTPAVARRWSALLRLLGIDARALDIQARGRAVAFNAGEAHAASGPRVYLDSNAVLSPGALSDLAAALAPGGGERFAALGLTTARPRSPVSRAYIRLWRATPYVARTGSTTGLYAVSAEGRNRWREFPLIHSDDKYVRLLFARHERIELPSSTYCVELPDGAVDLYRARVRYERGNRELARAFPRLLDGEPRRYAGLGAVVWRRPDLWAPAACVGLVQAAALTRVRWSGSGRSASLQAAGHS
jgi:hypothetical protein